MWAAKRGLIMGAILTEEGLASRSELNLPVTMTLTLSPRAAEMIESLSRDLGLSRDAIIGQSIVLLKVAADALKSGKAFGIAASPESLEVEVTGLGSKTR